MHNFTDTHKNRALIRPIPEDPTAYFIFIAVAYSANTQQISSTSKAGLAWPNGPYDDIDQYTSTGKVQW